MKHVDIEFGSVSFGLRVPERADVLSLPDVAALKNPACAIRLALANPIGNESLRVMAQRACAERVDTHAVIVVSDNTRPVPYKGEDGIIDPILEVLRGSGVARTTILVATGTHRALDNSELKTLLPPSAFQDDVRIINHVCTNDASLRNIGTTSRGTEAWVNTTYLDADIKILTGLVEPHFMAGFSGGRKSICPGLVGLESTHVFHGAVLMADPRADSLILDGNPCHEEALEVAHMAGCDFIVNATVDRHRRLTGIFCGDMEAAHEAACAHATDANAIPIDHEYDIVVTHAGFAGINHYQAAKAACEASKAVRPGGTIILAAHHTDRHPVGSAHYREGLALLATLGPDRIDAALTAPEWSFMPEQWEVQKWAQPLRTLGGKKNLIYCAPQLTGAIFADCHVPAVDGGEGLDMVDDAATAASAMVQRALDIRLEANPHATVVVLADGPYGVPQLHADDKREGTPP